MKSGSRAQPPTFPRTLSVGTCRARRPPLVWALANLISPGPEARKKTKGEDPGGRVVVPVQGIGAVPPTDSSIALDSMRSLPNLRSCPSEEGSELPIHLPPGGPFREGSTCLASCLLLWLHNHQAYHPVLPVQTHPGTPQNPVQRNPGRPQAVGAAAGKVSMSTGIKGLSKPRT